MIDQISAMRESIFLMQDRMTTHKYSIPTQESLSSHHLIEMLHKVDATWDEGKLGRWLGWVQASICSMGLATLDDFKQINKKWHIE